ncbi:MAG: hypothetical protein ACLFVO_10590 [Chloroflexaceae bacterium]
MDHEHHDMSETREPANADLPEAISGLVGDIASGRKKSVPCCRRRI